jgi:hypothetical protein
MRALAALPLAVVGGWTAVCAVALHGRTPWLVVAVAASALATWALPAGWPRFGFVVGWLVVLAVALLGRPEGDLLVAADWRGYTLLGTGLILLTYVVATVPRRAAKPGNGPSPT